MERKKICRGEIYYAALDPVLGSEQGGTRPVLVVQNDMGNQYGPTVIVAPITSRKKTYLPTHVWLPPRAGLPMKSMALLEQIRTIDRQRLQEYVGCANDGTMERIDAALGISVGLQDADIETPPDEMLLCLCPVCANQFFQSPEHIIRRVDPLQKKSEYCTYCNVRRGYDYRVLHKHKRLGDDLI